MAQQIQTKKKGSFRTNVIGTFLLIMIVSLGVTGVTSYYFLNIIGDTTTYESQEALEIQIKRNMNETAHKTALVINQKLAKAETLVSAIAAECENLFSDSSTFAPRETFYDYFFDNPMEGPTPDDVQYDTAREVWASWNYSSWYSFGTNSTNYTTFESTNADRLGRVSNLDYTFQYAYAQLPQFRWLYVAFTDGLFINYPGSIVSGTDENRSRIDEAFYYLEDYWYQGILEGDGDIVYIEPYFDPIDQVLLISIGRAIYDPDDPSDPIGIVAGDIPLDDINERILDVEILDSGNASLVLGSEYGVGVVAHWEVTSLDYENADALEQLPLLEDFVNLNSTQLDDIADAEQKVEDPFEFTQDEQEMFLAYAPVGFGGYICIIIVPADEVLRPLDNLNARIQTANVQATSFIIGATIVGAIIAVIVAGIVAGQITKPLEYLMGLAMSNVEAMIKEESLESDELRVDTVYTEQDDEIGELARAFQGMLDSIKEDEE